MDGNGRWAQRRGLDRSHGHEEGVHVVKTIVKACIAKHVDVLSVWAFGRENWARPTEEIDFLMRLFMQAIAREIDELHDNGVCLRFTGDRSQLSSVLCEAMLSAENLTANNRQLILNVVINYGGKWDIVQATKRLVDDALKGMIALEDIDEACFERQLNTLGLPDPDLFIRTSGEMRISNFFLWQLAYTEMYFTEVCWPDFTTEHFEEALAWFAARERRYGKISKQLHESVGV